MSEATETERARLDAETTELSAELETINQFELGQVAVGREQKRQAVEAAGFARQKYDTAKADVANGLADVSAAHEAERAELRDRMAAEQAALHETHRAALAELDRVQAAARDEVSASGKSAVDAAHATHTQTRAAQNEIEVGLAEDERTVLGMREGWRGKQDNHNRARSELAKAIMAELQPQR